MAVPSPARVSKLNHSTDLSTKSVDEASNEKRGSTASTDGPELFAASSAVIWTKVDVAVLPIVTMMYFLSSLVRFPRVSAAVTCLTLQSVFTR